MYGLPLVFAIFILLYSVPAGLLVYWITTNLWTVGQGYLIRKKLGPILPPKPATADGEEKEGGFLSKLTSGVGAPKEPAAATAKPATATAKPGPAGPPPRPPRKKKKRSGRRR